MDRKSYSTHATSSAAAYDEGLRTYLLKVYNYMLVGLGLTGVTAFVVASSPALFNLFFGTPLRWVILLAPLGMVFYLSSRMNSMTASKAQGAFWIFSTLMGASLAYIPHLYDGASLARVFLITAGTFGAMSLYGYTTKRDLTAMGSFMVMGIFGIILASIVNMFLQSSGLQFAVSALGVVIFTGLTAWDTQKIKQSYLAGEGIEMSSKKAIMGALTLYLDFINLFLMLLRLMGDRR
ncbi:MAG: Bax inhibitor-1/YccA family protein [bacterium]|nr:Bax inhibitor-1/YccA family protein [bacterium]